MSRVCLAAAVCCALCFSGPAWGSFVLLDNFDGWTLGQLAPQSTSWVTSDANSAQVGIDPANPNNQILVQSASNGYTRFYDAATTLVPDGSLGTLFFRIHVPGTTHTGIALSPLTNANDWPHGKSILRVGSGSGSDQNLHGYNQNGYVQMTDQTNPNTWYNVWMVVDNDAREAAYYLQSDYDADFATQTLISPALDSGNAYKFRPTATDGDLVSVLVQNSTSNGGTLYLDDFYIDNSAVNLASPLPPRTFGTPVAIYREIFPNPSSTNDLPLSSAGWFSDWGEDASEVGTQQAARAVGSPTDALPINSNPANLGLERGYLVTHAHDAYDGDPVLHWTDEYTIDRSFWGVTEIQWHQRNQVAADVTQVALRVGDDWFVSEEAFSNSSSNTWDLMQLDFPNANWLELSFNPGSLLELGGPTTFPSRGDITAFGLFVANATNTHRIDSFTILAIPEPASAVLLAMAGLCLALGLPRRRRRAG